MSQHLSMPHTPLTSGSIGPIQPGSPGQQPDKVSGQEALNPQRLNRSSIAPTEGQNHFGNGAAGVRGDQKHLPEFDIETVPGDQVKSYLSEEGEKKSGFESKVNQVRKEVEDYKKPPVKHESRQSKSQLQVQLKDAESALSGAKKIKREAHKLAENGLVSDSLRSAGLGGGDPSPVERHATRTFSEASQLVESWSQEVKYLKGALKANKKARTAEGKLEAGIRSLEESVQGLREKIVQPKAETKKEFGKHIRSLEKAISKAELAIKQGKRLDKRADAGAKAHGLDVSDLKQRSSQSVQTAQSELRKLKNDLSIAKDQRRSISKRAALEKKEQQKVRAHEKAQKRALRKAERELVREAKAFRKSAGETLKKDAVQDKAIQDKHRELGKKTSTAPSPEAVHKEKQAAVTGAREGHERAKSLAKKFPPLKPVKDMRPFLTGVKPASDLSEKGIVDSFSDLKTEADYKKALVSIGASKLGLKEKTRLRSNLSSALLGAIKNEKKFENLNRNLIEHVMFGDSMNEIQMEFRKAAMRAEAKIDQSVRRKK